MKKLLFTLLAVSIIFSACEEEDAAPLNNNNNNNNTNPSSIIGYGWGNDILYKTTDGGATWNFVNNLSNYGGGVDHKLSFSSEDIGILCGFFPRSQTFPLPDYYFLYYRTTAGGGLGFTDEEYVKNLVNNISTVPVTDYDNGSTFIETSGNSLWLSLRDAKLRKYTLTNAGTNISDGSVNGLYIGDNLGVINHYIKFKAISFLDDNIGFALSINGNISTTTNGGSSWAQVGSIPETDYSSCLDFPSSNVGYATANSWLYKTTDGGNTWTQFTQINIQDIEFVTDNIGYGFFSGMLYQTTDGGENWSMINDNSIGLSSISFIN